MSPHLPPTGDTGLLDAARDVLRDRFGYASFRPGQEAAVDSVLRGRDTLVVLPTGGGKSVCYQVPALILPKLTVVVSPLISLMKDQTDALSARGIPATFVNSSLSGSQISTRLAQALRGDVKLLYVAPERFDAGTVADRLRDSQGGISLLAVDEAHCISEWGHDFRPSYLRLADVRERLGNPPTIALTATATPHVRRDIATQLRLRSAQTIITGFDRSNLRYAVVAVPTDQAKDAAMVHAIARSDGPAIVYVPTRRGVDRISTLLAKARVSASAYHAGLDDSKRHEVQNAFMREEVRVIVATNAFGMGIDKPNVRIVLHYAMPGSLEAYYQEAGRAGRDGLAADCVLLHAYPDRFTHEFFIKGGYPERAVVEAVYDALREAAPSGVAVDVQAIPGLLKTKANEREVESALRILQTAGALVSDSDGGRRMFVRLLATPDRIRRDLGHSASDARELGMLRALWRAAGGRNLSEGTAIDLDGLPPGLGWSSGGQEVLRSLESRQFVELRPAVGGPRLSFPGRPIGAFRIDWTAFDRRRKADLEKLSMMQRYAYTKGCRRGFVLRYFGDQSARSSCTACDNCIGTTAVVDVPADDQRSRRRPRRGEGHARSDSHEATLELTGADRALLARLRDVRLQIARQQAVPAYVVFTDRSLAEMAVRRPRTRDQLSEVHGVGDAKLERYGERFLAEIGQFDETETA